MRALIAPLIVASLSAFAGEIVSESSQDLNDGFRLVRRAEKVSASFESIGHFTYFAYRKKILSQTDKYSISPSGKIAVYQDGPTGTVVLFRVDEGTQATVVNKFIALVEDFEWNEKIHTLKIIFPGKHPAIEVDLDQKSP